MGSYSSLARFMCDYPELLILRTFLELNVKNLLYYQAELAHLEVELLEVEAEDETSRSSPRRKFATSWRSLSTDPSGISLVAEHAHPLDSREAIQWQLVCRIRQVLRDYYAALKQHADVTHLLPPAPAPDIHSLRKWLETPDYGDTFLRGSPESVWDADKAFTDLCSFRHLRSKSPGLTSTLTKLLLHMKRRLTSATKPSGHVYTLDDRTEEQIANGIMTVASSVLPVLPIVILFFINRLIVRLGLILVFTAVFAGVLVFGMRVEPDKTLALTTAFAAIQVVFVGSTSNGQGG